MLLAGGTVMLVGILIAPLPGPGFTILGPIGLGIIASEFSWARSLYVKAEKYARQLMSRTDSLGSKTSRIWILPAVIAYWTLAWYLAEFSPIPSFVVWAVSFPIFMPVVLWAWASIRFRGMKPQKATGQQRGSHVTPPST